MTPRSRPKASSSSLVVHHAVLSVPSISNRSPTPSAELQQLHQSTLSNSSKNSSSSATEDQSAGTTMTKIASLNNLNQVVSAPSSTIVTPVLDSKYTFGDQLDQSINPFATQQTFSNDSLAQQFNEKLNCSTHRRNVSEASFLTKQFNNSSNCSLTAGNYDQQTPGSLNKSSTQLNPFEGFEDSFTNEQAIDHFFDELGKRVEERRKYTFV